MITWLCVFCFLLAAALLLVILKILLMRRALREICRELQEKLEEERKLSCFYRAVKQLPGAKREICLLKIYEGLNNQEIAHKLNIPVGTVKNYYTQSIQLLKYYLKELY